MVLAREIAKRVRDDAVFFSLEFFPPYSSRLDDIERFEETLDWLNSSSPLFVSITWFLRNNPGNLAITNSSSAIAALTKNRHGIETLLHLTCNGFPREETVSYLQQAVERGIHNVLALRGDDHNSGETQNNDFYALHLVRWARQLEQSRANGPLTVAVAGHPTGHPAANSYEETLDHLRHKVDAGADFVITQFFFEAADFEKFERDCRGRGIQVPIVAGVLLFKNTASLKRIAAISNVVIPPRIAAVLKANEKRAEVVQNFALHLAFELCFELLSRRIAHGIHLFTLNQRELTGLLLRRLGLWQTVNVHEIRLLKSVGYRKECEFVFYNRGPA